MRMRKNERATGKATTTPALSRTSCTRAKYESLSTTETTIDSLSTTNEKSQSTQLLYDPTLERTNERTNDDEPKNDIDRR
jgi:hypothetical protein